MDFTPGQRQLLAFWGTIRTGVEERMSTADLWAAVRDAAASEGVELKGPTAIDLGGLRAIAAGQRNARDTFQGARPDQSLDASHIGLDLSARSQADMNLVPSWIVRFEHDVVIDGQLQTMWRASVFDLSLPPTKGQLQAQVERDAQQMADKYGVTHVGVGRIEISAA